MGSADLIPVQAVGGRVTHFAPSQATQEAPERFERQVRAFGAEGQAVLRRLKTAIVGAGGTGSVAAQQLAHLGVSTVLLVDADTVEESNLNRVVGARKDSIGRLKTEVAADMIHGIDPTIKVETLAETAISHQALQRLRVMDAIFICTDSHSSRAFISEIAYQYLIPAFDIGTSINAVEGRVTAITGRTQMLAPGLPCLLCANAWMPAQSRRTDDPRAARRRPLLQLRGRASAGSHLAQQHDGVARRDHVPCRLHRHSWQVTMAILQRHCGHGAQPRDEARPGLSGLRDSRNRCCG